MPFHQKPALGVILLLALTLRFGWVIRPSSDVPAIASLPDQREYLDIGRNLLAGRGLQFTDPRFGQQVWAYRTPGYPLLIAACAGNVPTVRLVQALLDTSTVLAVALLAANWLPQGLCLFAAALAALNPWMIYFSGLLLSDTLFTTMLAWGLVLSMRNGGLSIFALIILAVSVLVRPSAIALPILLVFAVKRKPAWALSSGALTILVLFPWALRNDHRVGAWVWTTTNAGITQYDGFNPAATGASDQSFVAGMPELAKMDEVARSRYLSKLAGQFIREHPATCIKLAIAKIGRLWSPFPLSAQFSRPLYVAIGLAYSVPLFALTLLGLLRQKNMRLILFMPAIYFTVIHAASVASLRYRLPAEPPMAALAAGALAPAMLSRKKV